MHPSLKAYVDHLRLTGRSQLTVRRYGEVLRELDRAMAGVEPAAMARQDLLRFAVAPRADHRPRAPAGVNLRVAVLKAAFSYLHGEGVIPVNAVASLVGVKESRGTPDYLSATETTRLLVHVANRKGPNRLRDLVLALVFWQTGLRVSEVARLTWTQLDPDRYGLRGVSVKGGHRRDVPLNDEVMAALRVHRAGGRGPHEAGPIFAGRGGRPLSVRAIQALFATWRVELGWTRRLHPHVLRRTHATGALALGVDIATVADLLGHSDLRTVMAYAAVQEGPRRAALRQLGGLVPAEILKEIGFIRSPANDAEKSTCVEERFDDDDKAA